jgi:hypothetical protein
MLIDDGRLVREGGGWRAVDELSAVTVPPSIQALLAARLDRLSQEERVVLEAAAVIGRDVFASAVRELLPEDARERVPSDLMRLVRKELIQPIPTTLRGEDAFRFRHLLIRDAVYDAVAKSRRAELHERFADWLERVAGEAVSEEEEIVAYHLERAFSYRRELGPADARSDALGRRAGCSHAPRPSDPTAGPSGRGLSTTSARRCKRRATNPPRSRRSTRRSGWRRVPTTPRWDGARASRGPRCRRRSTHGASRRSWPAPRSRRRSRPSRRSATMPGSRTRGRGLGTSSSCHAGTTTRRAPKDGPSRTRARAATTGSCSMRFASRCSPRAMGRPHRKRGSGGSMR